MVRTLRTALLVFVAVALVAAGCGGNDDPSEGAEASVPPPAPAPEPEPAPAPEPEPAPAPEPEPASETAADSGSVAVVLFEWGLTAPSEIAAGPVVFDVVNDGNFGHQLSIVKGDSYETLPQLGNGAVDEEALGEGDLIGKTMTFGGGSSDTLEVDLAPGNYVLYCDIAVGPNSHAAQGQVLAITVG